MTDTARKTLLGVLGLLALGVAVGVANNLTAGKSRRLDWVVDYPAKGKPQCPETLPAPGAEATAVSPEAGAPVASVGVEPADTAPVEPPPETGATGAPAMAPEGSTGPPAASPAAPVGSAPAPAPAPADVSIPPVPPDKQWLELSPAQVKALKQQGSLFIDARETKAYEAGHVPGALSIPIWESGVDDKVAQVMFEVQGDNGRPIVVYCNGGECEDSHMLGDKLAAAGHTAVYVYKDGFPNWQDSGMPVTTGATR